MADAKKEIIHILGKFIVSTPMAGHKYHKIIKHTIEIQVKLIINTIHLILIN